MPCLSSLVFAQGTVQSAIPQAATKNETEHVVMMVWDGLRPDSVSAQNTPNLFRLAQSGVTFSRHHPVYPSSTEVNGAALATGSYPEHSGVIANKEFRPDIDPLQAIATEDLEAVRKGDAKTPYLLAPTLAEIIQASGSPTAIAGTKPVALLGDRLDKRTSPAARASSTVFEGQALSPASLEAIVKAQGVFPPTIEFPNTKEDAWTTRALTQTLWKGGVPKFSQLWLSDVDYTQHDSAPGSPAALAALKSCDNQLAAVLAALDAQGVRSKTAIFVVSDHGFSTISRQVDVYAALKEAGFKAPKKFAAPPQNGEVMVVGLGGSALFYVGGHDRIVTQRLAQFLQTTNFAGVLWSRDALQGTFPLALAKMNSAGAPDLVMSFRWDSAANRFGVPGSILSEGKRIAGQGSHASLSAFDMHNTCIAAGPDFKTGFIDTTPSGNVDLAPTILHLLGLNSPSAMDGRVLGESLRNSLTLPSVQSGKLESTSKFNGQNRSQYLLWQSVDGVVYFDEGNSGAPAP
ncbi:alkaline phosphatase family protein [Abditibacterium utsteinense]|uniref:alkaline phosphatase family protein n=1 Tax=Abditibacterium utsteinense TaxID=1960156 RepID=UPI00130035AC|nr:alkaline phosphatase family protein [Abditibacterium utsteinense]